MRWDNLFDDLESQLEFEEQSRVSDLRAEEERLRLGQLGLRDRLLTLIESAGPGDGEVTLGLSGRTLVVRPTVVGRDWLFGGVVSEPRSGGRHERGGEEPGIRSHALVPFLAIRTIGLTSRQVTTSLAARGEAGGDTSFSARLGLGFVLRDLCRRRMPVRIHLAESSHFGTIDRVGRDHLDLAEHDPGEARRESAVRQRLVVPFVQVVLVAV